jgi:hypothetical protein
LNTFLRFRTATTGETETNRQLLLKLKKNEYGELTSRTIPNDNIINNNNEYTNGHSESLHETLKQENKSLIQPHITNMLSNLNDDNQWNDHQINSNQISQQTTTTRYIELFRFISMLLSNVHRKKSTYAHLKILFNITIGLSL